MQNITVLKDLFFKEDNIENLTGEAKSIGNSKKVLSQNGQLFFQLANSLSDAILVEDDKKNIIYTNDAFCLLFNIHLTPAEMMGSPISLIEKMLLGQFTLNETILAHFDSLRYGKDKSKKYFLDLIDGRVLELRHTSLDFNGEYIGHSWIYKDVSESILSTKKLQAQKRLFDTILNILPVDVAVFNPEFSDLFLNPIAIKDAELRKWVIDWLIGNEKGNDTYENKNVNGNRYYFNQVIKTRSLVSWEEQRDNAGQTEHYLRNMFPVIDDTGDIIMLIGYNVNITDRIKAEKELMIAKKMTEDASIAKEAFLANMSHEIRTPMNGIMGVISLLAKTQLSNQQKDYLKLVMDSVNNLLVIVNDILDLEKIASGKIELEHIPFNIIEKIENAVKSFEFKMEEKGLQLIFTKGLPEEMLVEGDPYRLVQILNNLLSNALKFTTYGYVSVLVKEVLEEMMPGYATILLEVVDTGIGIEKSRISAIFDPYTQGSSDTTRKYGGTGLGLSIVKNLIELQGGELRVESNYGEGSKFSFKIPYKIGQQLKLPENEDAEVAFIGLGGKRVLMAEDVELNQFLATTFLESWGCEVTTAQNGKEAIELLEKENFDVVLMDIYMPEMDGVDATKHIRTMEDPLKKKIPIIALTANAIKGNEDVYLEVGMNNYVSKPFTEKQLFTTICKSIGVELHFLKTNKINQINDINSSKKEMMDEKLYNPKLLMSMSKGKSGFVEKMMSIFITNIPIEMEKLLIAVNEENWELVQKYAHKMKPSIEGICISSINQLVVDIEKFAKSEKSKEKIPTLTNQLNQKLIDVITQIKIDYSF